MNIHKMVEKLMRAQHICSKLYTVEQ